METRASKKQGVSHQLGTTPKLDGLPGRSHSTVVCGSRLDDARCDGCATMEMVVVLTACQV